jgi:PIN domain nuclease of toxin-antitoxin system
VPAGQPRGWRSETAALHDDPFDRLLAAQAISESLHLLTANPQLQVYLELLMVL